ncbi:hypothetical protein BGZ61DRAFT_113044 [Ilyonectria robusta]|uniref:uncharacterized protein n=1 Tax=Ilyonectria robusta TaxID=1079257 RepID=UPI001E8D2AEA|nr:uncharacterized protein BGZ61DRAFT_113044 [Ilyonectria robusta]KAH8669972.1 hypothetical protein BGZ61DRAFT_113044 [Ilyonectria robusta]
MRLIGRGDSFARERRGNLQDGRRNTRDTRHGLDAACVRASRSLSRRCRRWRAHRICVCHGFALGELRCVGNGCTVWNSFANSQQPTANSQRDACAVAMAMQHVKIMSECTQIHTRRISKPALAWMFRSDASVISDGPVWELATGSRIHPPQPPRRGAGRNNPRRGLSTCRHADMQDASMQSKDKERSILAVAGGQR